MGKAPVPENEVLRLKKLRGMRVLDTPIEERFERITRIVCRTLGVPISAISLVDEERQWFKSIQGLEVSETSRDVAFCAHAILEDKAFVVQDATTDSRFADNPLVTEDPSIRFYAGIPINMGNDVRIGTLCAIDRKPRSFSPEDEEILKDLADMVRSELEAVTMSEAHESLIAELQQAERAALIDPLTRLWNRAGAEQLIAREWLVAERKEMVVGIMMIDIDHFKLVNDSHGHAVGDQILRQFAIATLRALRPSDIVCRWGGEEFLVILPNCSEEHLEDILDRLINILRSQRYATDRGDITVTASIGATCAAAPMIGKPDQYIKMADDHLYEAKQQGRDRYVTYVKSS